MSKGKYLYSESGELNPCLYKKGDFLATESGTYITTEHGQMILLREHPCPNPNFSIKCSEYFGTNLMVIKSASFHFQLSLTDNYLYDKENHATTDFIEIDPLKNYAFTSNASFFRIAFYDASKQFISSESTEVVFNQRWIEDLPSNAKYIRISAEYFTIKNWGLYELTADKAFAITYYDKKVEVHLPDFYGVTRALVGSPDLFSLSYISDTKDKGQTIMSTEADINIYQDDYFNIDNLATSGETDIKIQYYESDLLIWSGFVLPDFFEVDIKPNPIISMVATDRLGVLKEIDFNGERQTPKYIVLDCLSKTGLTLDSTIIYQNSYFETATINLERYDGMSCYDVLTSVLTAFNAKVVQYGNKWNIINKLTLETRPTSNIIQIGLIDVNGRREIKPVASEVSMKMEFGGSKKYPNNWNFEEWTSNVLDNWTSYNGFVQNKNSKVPLSYDSNYSLIYGQDTNINSLLSRNAFRSQLTDPNFINSPHIRSDEVSMQFIEGVSELNFEIDFTSINDDRLALDIVLLIRIPNNNPAYDDYIAVGQDGRVVEAGTTNIDLTEVPTIRIQPAVDENQDRLTAIRTTAERSFKISALEDLGLTRVTSANVQVILFGTEYYDGTSTSLIDIVLHSTKISFNDFETKGKGLIFKIKQGGDKFSKVRETETTHFSDKINQGVNGYFYNYKYDDTSITNLPNEFILQNTLREQTQMFSKARDFLSLSGNIKVNPLARYICGDKQYVLVGGTSGRKKASVQLEEIVSENLTKIDYIYTYFD